MPRSKPSAFEARAISGRLKEFAEQNYESVDGFVRALSLNPSTADAWLDQVTPRVPDSEALLRIGRKTMISLDWLLLGEGPVMRNQLGASPEETTVALLGTR